MNINIYIYVYSYVYIYTYLGEMHQPTKLLVALISWLLAFKLACQPPHVTQSRPNPSAPGEKLTGKTSSTDSDDENL